MVEKEGVINLEGKINCLEILNEKDTLLGERVDVIHCYIKDSNKKEHHIVTRFVTEQRCLRSDGKSPFTEDLFPRLLRIKGEGRNIKIKVREYEHYIEDEVDAEAGEPVYRAILYEFPS